MKMKLMKDCTADIFSSLLKYGLIRLQPFRTKRFSENCNGYLTHTIVNYNPSTPDSTYDLRCVTEHTKYYWKPGIRSMRFKMYLHCMGLLVL